MLTKPEPLFVTNSCWNAARGAVVFNDGLSAFWLDYFTTNGAQMWILVWKAEYRMVGKPPTS